MDNSYQVVDGLLVRLFNEIMDIEEKAIITGEFCDITNNDMHIIEAVGLESPMNMSSIARKLAVTVGALTISMNSLVKKGYVLRERSDRDRRVVLIRLTEKGVRAYHHHQDFHREMIEAVMAGLDEGEKEVLIRSLERLMDFFMDYKKRHEEER